MADEKIVEELRRKTGSSEFEKLLAQMREWQKEEYERRLHAFWSSLAKPPFIVTI